MKVLLMHRDRDFRPLQDACWNEADLTKDLELPTLWRAMAGDDEFLAKMAREATLSGLANDLDTILYRQAVLRDCLAHPDAVRAFYDLAVSAIEEKHKHYFGILSSYPSAVLHGSIDVLEMFVGKLRALRDMAQHQMDHFDSEGFKQLFAMLQQELDEAYLDEIQAHLKALKFRHGVLLSAELDEENRGKNYLVRKPNKKVGWWARLLGHGVSAYTFQLAPRDEAGAQALSNIEGRGINLLANALAQSADHIEHFFEMLRKELAFYIGCFALHQTLSSIAEPVCFPVPVEPGQRKHRFHGLYDVCLALQMGRTVVGNTVDADGRDLVIITGANQGGKSSFLRSIGLAQVMMQCGMFVAAETFEAELCKGLWTHYKREEDVSMERGKFEEEIARMDDIAKRIQTGAMVLFNESFAATNEREGSEISRQVVSALIEKRIKVFFVTHFYEFAHGFCGRATPDVLFLRPERLPDGTRTFRLVEAEPQQTSHGEDLYRRIFSGQGKQERVA